MFVASLLVGVEDCIDSYMISKEEGVNKDEREHVCGSEIDWM